MHLSPVALREALVAARRSRLYHLRWIIGGCALVLIGIYLLGNPSGTSQGRDLLVLLGFASYAYCLLAGAILTADAVSVEKRDDTLGLLFLTHLKAGDILAGKMTTAMAGGLCGLLTLLPMLAVPLLLGGVTVTEFWKLAAGLLVALFVASSWGMFVSSITRQAHTSLTSALTVVLLAGWIVPSAARELVTDNTFGTTAWACWLLAPSHPIEAVLITANPFHGYWLALALNILAGAGLLAVAQRGINAGWRTGHRPGWRNHLAALRQRFGKSKNAWLLATLFGIGIVAVWWRGWLRMANSGEVRWGISSIAQDAFWLCLALHIVLCFRLAAAAAFQVAEERREGSLEILLSTPLSVREILRRHFTSVRRRFSTAVLMALIPLAGIPLLAVVELGFERDADTWHAFRRDFWNALNTRRDEEWMLGLLLPTTFALLLPLNWWMITKVATWLGLRVKHAANAIWISIFLVAGLPWAFTFGLIFLILFGKLYSQIEDELLSWIVLGLIWIFVAGQMIWLNRWANRSLRERFREAAVDRYITLEPWVHWRRLGRRVLRFTLAGLVIAILWWAIVARRNHRAEKAWADYRASLGEPAFDPSIFNPDPASDGANLAKHPLLVNFSTAMEFLMDAETTFKFIRLNWHNSDSGSHIRRPMPVALWMNSRLSDFSYPEGTLVQQAPWSFVRPGFLRTYVPVKQVIGEEAHLTVSNCLARFNGVIAEFHAAAERRPVFQLEMRSSYEGASIDCDTRTHELLVLLALRAQCALACANPEPAFKDLRLALRLTQGFAISPQLNQQLHEALLDCVQPVYDGLRAHAWNAEQLHKLQKAFEMFDLWIAEDRFRRWHAMKLAEQGKQLLNGMEPRRRTTRPWDPPSPSDEERIRLLFHTRGWIRDRQLELHDFYWRAAGAALDPVGPQLLPRRADALNSVAPEPYVFHEDPPAWLASMQRFALAETVRRQVVIACALESFRLANGAFPQTLAELAPEFLASIPEDPVTRRAMPYSPDARGGYLLLGAGWDGKLPPDGQPRVEDNEDQQDWHRIAAFSPDWPWRMR